MLFRLDRLMQTVGIAAARHDTSGKFVYDKHLIVFYYIILIPEHQVVRTERQYDIVLDLQILGIGKIFNLKETLYFGNARLRQIHHFILFVYDKISRFFSFHAHDGVHLGQLFHILAAGKLPCQNVAGLIEFRGFSALSGYDKRRSRFVDQNGVHFVDNGIMQFAQYKLLFINDHIVSQIVKAQLIIRHIGNIAGIGFSSFFRLHIV